MIGFYEQCTEHPELGWIAPLSAWAPIWGVSVDELDADYKMQMALTGTFHMRKEWTRHAKGLLARYGTEDLDVLYRGEKCGHVWPAELEPNALCENGCGLEYGEWSA